MSFQPFVRLPPELRLMIWDYHARIPYDHQLISKLFYFLSLFVACPRILLPSYKNRQGLKALRYCELLLRKQS